MSEADIANRAGASVSEILGVVGQSSEGLVDDVANALIRTVSIVNTHFLLHWPPL